MALESTQPLTEMSTRSISWGGKGGRCVRLTTYHHPVPLSRNLGTLTFWNTLGPSGPVTGLLTLPYLTLPYLTLPYKEMNRTQKQREIWILKNPNAESK